MKQTTRQWPINSNRGMVFFVESIQRCYKPDKLGTGVSWLFRWRVSQSVSLSRVAVAETGDSMGTQRKGNVHP
jgi:hypothetical protein